MDDHISLLQEIKSILCNIQQASLVRPDIDFTVQISSNNPYVVDYRDRYRIYMWSSNALTLTLEDIGTFSVSANAWNNISFTTGMRVFAQSQSSLVSVLIRCTDLEMPSPTGSASVLGAVTANAGTNLNTSLLALESGGNLASIVSALDDGQETMANSLSVTVASDQSAVPISGTITANAGTNLNTSGLALESGGNLASILTQVTNHAVTQSGTWTIQPGNTPNTSPWLTQDVVASSGGSIPYHNLTAATTNFTNVKAAACQLYGFKISNTSASVIFVKFYDKASAPTTGDVPKDTIMINANTLVIYTIPEGEKFASGFGWGATGAVADNDNTAIAANCVVDFRLNS